MILMLKWSFSSSFWFSEHTMSWSLVLSTKSTCEWTTCKLILKLRFAIWYFTSRIWQVNHFWRVSEKLLDRIFSTKTNHESISNYLTKINKMNEEILVSIRYALLVKSVYHLAKCNHVILRLKFDPPKNVYIYSLATPINESRTKQLKVHKAGGIAT